ncbi:MAG TPA: hypothetical protein DD727_00020, partial [Clostridiales bacterium]|nr:hypothetical protein [Clostridiales bacterium]
IGHWYKSVRESYIHSENDSLSRSIETDWVYLTCSDKNLYLHLNSEPMGSCVEIKPLEILPTQVVLLNDGTLLEARRDMGVNLWKKPMGYMRIRNIPVEKFPDSVMVLKLTYDNINNIIFDKNDTRISERVTHPKFLEGVVP